MNNQFHRENRILVEKERAITHYIFIYYLQYGTVDKEYLESQNISLITDANVQKKIVNFFRSHQKPHGRYMVDIMEGKRVILIRNNFFSLFLENKNRPEFPLETILVFISLIIILGVLYWWTISSLKPLRELKEKIKYFSKGNLDIECKSNSDDEIGALANEFNNAVKIIRELIGSRQLFLRAIMHELKTPIAKGRISAEMITDTHQKERMNRIFERLNLLIDEFAKIEKITSRNFKLNIKPYRIADIIDASIDMLLIDNPQKHFAIQINKEIVLNVDFELFTLVLKNLFANAIEYSISKKVNIIIDDEIKIINDGESLRGDITEYYKPFHASKKGLGLGIYIVKNILDMHNMHLKYSYQDSKNIFTISTLLD
jgi:two-component system OmpR family sensor kinase